MFIFLKILWSIRPKRKGTNCLKNFENNNKSAHQERKKTADREKAPGCTIFLREVAGWKRCPEALVSPFT